MKVIFENTKTKSWILIKLDYKIDRFNFEEALKIILKEFDDEEIKFVGWFQGQKVISIGGDNYIVMARDDMIKLKLTRNKLVGGVPDKRKVLFEKYTKMLDELKKTMEK